MNTSNYLTIPSTTTPNLQFHSFPISAHNNANNVNWIIQKSIKFFISCEKQHKIHNFFPSIVNDTLNPFADDNRKHIFELLCSLQIEKFFSLRFSCRFSEIFSFLRKKSEEEKWKTFSTDIRKKMNEKLSI